MQKTFRLTCAWLGVGIVVISVGGCGSDGGVIEPTPEAALNGAPAGSFSSSAGASSGGGTTAQPSPSPGPDPSSNPGGSTAPELSGVFNGRCVPNAPFGAPELVAELDGTVDLKRGGMTSDELEIVYLRNDGGGPGGLPTLRRGRRATLDAKWEVDTLPSLDPPAADLGTLSPSGLTLVYYENSQPENLLRVARRASRNEPFGASIRVEPQIGRLFGGSLVGDDLLYHDAAAGFARAPLMAGVRGEDTPVISTSPDRAFLMAVNAKQTTLIFEKWERARTTTHFVHRRSPADAFGTPVNMPVFRAFDRPFFVSNDDCVVYHEGFDGTRAPEDDAHRHTKIFVRRRGM